MLPGIENKEQPRGPKEYRRVDNTVFDKERNPVKTFVTYEREGEAISVADFEDMRAQGEAVER